MEDVYWDADHYDLMHENTSFDFELYKSMAKRFGDPILEIACGTGRLSIMLAREGYRVYGIDINRKFLQIAERKRVENKLDNTVFISKDFRSYDLSMKFPFIFIPFNSFLHVYSHRDAKSFLKCVKRHMNESSRFLISIFNPDLKLLMRDPSNRYPVAEYEIPLTKEKVIVTENNIYDRASQINHISWYFRVGDREETKRELQMRIYYPLEIDCLLESNGLIIENKWGSHQLEDFNSASDLQIILCRKNK